MNQGYTLFYFRMIIYSLSKCPVNENMRSISGKEPLVVINMRYDITFCSICSDAIVVEDGFDPTLPLCQRLQCVLKALPDIFEDQPELSQKIVSINLEKKPTVYGHALVSEAMELLKKLRDGNLPKNRTERYACYRLIQKHGIERVKKAITFAFNIRQMPYAPSIYSFTELEERWLKLEDFGIKYKSTLQQKSKGAFHEDL